MYEQLFSSNATICESIEYFRQLDNTQDELKVKTIKFNFIQSVLY